MRKKIAVNVQSEVAFYTVEPLLEKMRDLPYEVTIVMDEYENDDNGWADMSRHLIGVMKKYGYNAKSIKECDGEVFDLVLSPYVDKRIKAKIRLKYEYGTLNIKPKLTYLPVFMDDFDGFLCQSTVTKNILSAYGQTFPVDNLRFNGSKIEKHNGKKRILLAPTYNECFSEDWAEVIRLLKEDFIVMFKSHHGTQYLKEYKSERIMAEQLVDEYYSAETKLTDLILKADVCLFGNSSAIGEAVYAGVPCVIYTKDLSLFQWGELQTTQQEMVKMGFPYAKRKEEILSQVKFAMSARGKKILGQFTERYFPAEFRTGVDGYVDVIRLFLEDSDEKDYLNLRKMIIKERKKEYQKLRSECSEKQKQCEEQEKELADCRELIDRYEGLMKEYKEGKLYRLATKLYSLEGRIRNGKD